MRFCPSPLASHPILLLPLRVPEMLAVFQALLLPGSPSTLSYIPFLSASTGLLYSLLVPVTWDREGSVCLLQSATGEAGNAAAASGN